MQPTMPIMPLLPIAIVPRDSERPVSSRERHPSAALTINKFQIDPQPAAL